MGVLPFSASLAEANLRLSGIHVAPNAPLMGRCYQVMLLADVSARAGLYMEPAYTHKVLTADLSRNEIPAERFTLTFIASGTADTNPAYVGLRKELREHFSNYSASPPPEWSPAWELHARGVRMRPFPSLNSLVFRIMLGHLWVRAGGSWPGFPDKQGVYEQLLTNGVVVPANKPQTPLLRGPDRPVE